MAKPTRKELADHYRILRAEARQITAGALASGGLTGIRLTDINQQALVQAATWTGRKVGWDWDLDTFHLPFGLIPPYAACFLVEFQTAG
jgi:hypothetical protein